MPRTAYLCIGAGLGALIAGPLATTLTTAWYELWFLPRIAADFDPGPGLWLEKRG